MIFLVAVGFISCQSNFRSKDKKDSFVFKQSFRLVGRGRLSCLLSICEVIVVWQN